MVVSRTLTPEKIQVLITKEAAERLRVAGALTRKHLGEVISELAEKHLPASTGIALIDREGSS
jgi:hypothetical protein